MSSSAIVTLGWVNGVESASVKTREIGRGYIKNDWNLLEAEFEQANMQEVWR